MKDIIFENQHQETTNLVVSFADVTRVQFCVNRAAASSDVDLLPGWSLWDCKERVGKSRADLATQAIHHHLTNQKL